ncbi:hypothetical protein J6590_060822 [Homalodisca vitripennis]|nr:hypothetical protein J6590_060822 [Homalodisca vitripennis]
MQVPALNESAANDLNSVTEKERAGNVADTDYVSLEFLGDTERLRNSMRASAELKKRARQTERQSKRKLEDKEEDPDNPSYGAGLF